MAGGWIGYDSAIPDGSGNVFDAVYVPATGTPNASPNENGLGVTGSLGADSVWYLRFPMPPSIPTGTFKVRLLGLSQASSGTAKITVSDGRCPAGSAPSTATLTAETQVSLTWTAADVYVESKFALTTVPQANDIIVMALTFNTTGWTLLSSSVWRVKVGWE